MTPYGLMTYWARKTHKLTLMKIEIFDGDFQPEIPTTPTTTTTHHWEGDHQVEDCPAVDRPEEDLMEIKTHGFHECLEDLMAYQAVVIQEDPLAADHH